MQALEKANVEQDIVPFADFLGYLVGQGLSGEAVAGLPDR